MAYIDLDYYQNEFKGTSTDAETFATLSERATDLIDMITGFKLIGADLTSFNEHFQSYVKKAVASQVEYMISQGGETSIHGNSLASASLGGFSYSENGENQKGIISPMVINYLRPTGLLYRGIKLC